MTGADLVVKLKERYPHYKVYQPTNMMAVAIADSTGDWCCYVPDEHLHEYEDASAFERLDEIIKERINAGAV
jgi:hypothetical protein